MLRSSQKQEPTGHMILLCIHVDLEHVLRVCKQRAIHTVHACGGPDRGGVVVKEPPQLLVLLLGRKQLPGEVAIIVGGLQKKWTDGVRNMSHRLPAGSGQRTLHLEAGACVLQAVWLLSQWMVPTECIERGRGRGREMCVCLIIANVWDATLRIKSVCVFCSVDIGRKFQVAASPTCAAF